MPIISRPKRSSTNCAATNGDVTTSIANKKRRQEQALTQLMELRQENTGHTLHHDIANIVATCNDPCVTYSSLHYKFSKSTSAAAVAARTKKISAVMVSAEKTMPLVSKAIYGGNESVASDVSNFPVTTPKTGQTDSERIQQLKQQNLLQDCTRMAAEMYGEAWKDALKVGKTVEKDTLKYILMWVEMLRHLPTGSLSTSANTVACRAASNYLNPFRPDKINPLHKMEPMVARLIIENRSIYRDQKTILDLARNSAFEIQLMEHRRTKQISPLCRPADEHIQIGEEWYNDFCERHSYIWEEHKCITPVASNVDQEKNTAESGMPLASEIAYYCNQKDDDDDTSALSDVSCASAPSLKARSTETTNRRHAILQQQDDSTLDLQEQRLLHFTAVAAQRFTKAREEAQFEGGSVPINALKYILESVELQYHLTVGSLCLRTVSDCSYSNDSIIRRYDPNPLGELDLLMLQALLVNRRRGLYLDKKLILRVVSEHLKERGDSIMTRWFEEDATAMEKWYRSFRRRHSYIWTSPKCTEHTIGASRFINEQE